MPLVAVEKDIPVPQTAEVPHTALNPCVPEVPQTADVPHTAL